MRKRSMILSACVVVGGLALPLRAQDATGGMSGSDTATPPATQPGTIGDRVGGTVDRTIDRATGDNNTNAMAPDAKDIRGMLKDATEAGVKKDGFDNLVRRFVDADRDRISKSDKSISKEDWNKLNGRIDKLRKDWKAKYNQDFDIDHPEMVFNDQFRIIQGKIGEAQPAGARMGDSNRDTTGNATGNAGATDKSPAPDTTPGAEANKTGGGDTNREPGRRVAKVTFPAESGMPTLYIPLIREFPDAWKIDVPDQVDGRRLYDNLLNHLTMFDDQQAQWPTDVNDAYRMVSHHVLAAVLDVNEKSGDMDRSGMNRDNTMPGNTGTGTGR
jgi:hypothetical protein